MNAMSKAPEKELTRLDELATEARAYSEALVMNIFQLGRVFMEAKPMAPPGQWRSWLQANSGMDVRLAQQAMQTYVRFGDRPALAGVQKSKLFKMLALPEERVDDFVEDHDLQAMTAREVEAAVRKVRDEMQTMVDAERAARRAAEQRVQTPKESEPPPELLEQLREKDEKLRLQKEEYLRLHAAGKAALDETNRLRRENARLQSEIEEQNELLVETQAQYDRAQADLLNAQSAIARGDAERSVTDVLTLDVFAAAVRQFVGSCARLPHMGKVFAGMAIAEYEQYEELLMAIEGWARETRRAMDTISGEVIGGE